MRVVAILASYNERRFMKACLQHYREQGVEVYLLDNESTDETVEIAREFSGDPLIGVESISRRGDQVWQRILRRKEDIADKLKADWLMHADPDEFRVAAMPGLTLAEAFGFVDREGYNAVNFMEFVFVPTRESPSHDHPDFRRTMRWYYPFSPRHPHRLNAWKKQGRQWRGVRAAARELVRHGRWHVPSVDLHSMEGHIVRFPGIKPYPEDFTLKHYIILSVAHATEKYVQRRHAEQAGHNMWVGWRATVTESELILPSQQYLRPFTGDAALDPSDPQTEHLIVALR